MIFCAFDFYISLLFSNLLPTEPEKKRQKETKSKSLIFAGLHLQTQSRQKQFKEGN